MIEEINLGGGLEVHGGIPYLHGEKVDAVWRELMAFRRAQQVLGEWQRSEQLLEGADLASDVVNRLVTALDGNPAAARKELRKLRAEGVIPAAAVEPESNGKGEVVDEREGVAS